MANTKAKATAPKRVPFGGYTVCGKGCADALEELFGSALLPPSAMTKRLREYVKRHGLGRRGRRHRAGAGGPSRRGWPAPVGGASRRWRRWRRGRGAWVLIGPVHLPVHLPLDGGGVRA
jgi:hypothetical protein